MTKTKIICPNCGENTTDEIFECEDCGNPICEECMNVCKKCGAYLCDGCYHDHKSKCS